MGTHKSLAILALLLTAGMITAQPRWSDYQYDPDNGAFPNPERGFYKYTSRGNAEESLSGDMLRTYREDGYTLIYRIYYISEFVESPISQDYLDRIREDFQVVRQSGLKVVLRFAYTSKSTEPYGDATPDWVLHHIGQLGPLVRENADVIAVWQAGFIGAWGEWYYTDHFATGSPGNVTEEDLQEREAVVRAMLNALPLNRQVQLRTPEHKRRIFGDEPLSDFQAYDGSDQARTGHHNDCFLSSSNDVGTYHSSIDRPYLLQDSKFTSMGGETCRWFEPRSNCDTAMVEMDRYNWDYLNIDYFGETIQQWKDNGCFDEIWKKLGYRYRMVSAAFMDSASIGGGFAGRIELINEGFSNPMNERYPELVLRNVMSGEEYFLRMDQDLRLFPEGEPVVLEFEGGIPGSMAAGYYELFLNLPDPMQAISGDPNYSIRLANAGAWEEETGYNATQHTLVVDPEAAGMENPGGTWFAPRDTSGLFLYRPVTVDADTVDWEKIPTMAVSSVNSYAGEISLYNDGIFLYGLVQGSGLDTRQHRFYFDLDQDAVTGYGLSAWNSGGADGLLEDGVFSRYTGGDGGTEWSWEPVQSVPFTITGAAVEWAIPLVLNENVKVFDMGYENNPAGQQDPEYLPAGGSDLLTYTLDQYLEETPEMFITTYGNNALIYWGLLEGEEGYRVLERADSPTAPFRVLTRLSPDVVSYTDRNLISSQTYRYRSYLTDQQVSTLPTGVTPVTPSGEDFLYTLVEPDGADGDWVAVAPVTAVYGNNKTTALKLFGNRNYLNFLISGMDGGSYRIYLDADPGAGTGSGPGVWEEEAFDWMISGDSVFTWNMEWTYRGEAETASGTGLSEGRVPYALFDSMPGLDFKVGVVTGESGNETFLPFRGEESAEYTRIKPAEVPAGFVVKGSLEDPSGRLIPQWEKNTEVGGYDLERSAGDSLQFEVIATLGRKEYRYIDEEVEPDSDYWYRVRTYNMAGPSAFTRAVHGHTFGVGITDHAPAGPLRIYPNPAGEILRIRLEDPGLVITGAVIYDVTGKKVAQFEGDLRSLSVEELPPGLYHLKVDFAEGSADTRFIKQ